MTAKHLGDPGDPLFALRHSPFFLLSRLSNRYVLDMEAKLKKIGMDIPTWRTLMIVREREPSSVSEIADLACIRLSTMTRVVQRLLRAGLVRVRRRAGDGRKTDVYLTGAGRAACDAVRRIASRVYHHAFADFDSVGIADCCALLRRIHDNLTAPERPAAASALPKRRTGRGSRRGPRTRGVGTQAITSVEAMTAPARRGCP